MRIRCTHAPGDPPRCWLRRSASPARLAGDRKDRWSCAGRWQRNRPIASPEPSSSRLHFASRRRRQIRNPEGGRIARDSSRFPFACCVRTRKRTSSPSAFPMRSRSPCQTLESVIVRSPQAANATSDVRAIGRDLAVDVVLTGTLMRAGNHVRVSAQLADAEAGTLIWSDVTQAPIEDLFSAPGHADESHPVVAVLPLTARDRQSLDRHAPASAEAYELYLRANELARNPSSVDEARDCTSARSKSIPTTPAWAALGRTRRVIAKWAGKAASGSSRWRNRPFAPWSWILICRWPTTSPPTSMRKNRGARRKGWSGCSRAAIRRTDTGVLAGLVTTCRYAGLFEESKAAHNRAVMLDPARKTSVAWTHFMLGEYDAAVRTETGTPPTARFSRRWSRGS